MDDRAEMELNKNAGGGGRVCPGECLPWGGCLPGGVYPGARLPGGVCLPGGGGGVSA